MGKTIDPTRPRVTRNERITIAVITVTFTMLLILWAFLTPMFGAPDEIAHFDAAVQFALGHGWPPPSQLRLLTASRAMQNEGMGVLAQDRPTIAQLLAAFPGPAAVNQMTQHPPTWYAMAAAVLHVIGFKHQRWDIDLLSLRLMNVAIVATLPLVIWAAIRNLTRSPKAAIVGAAAVLLIPQIAFNGSSVTNDTPVIILGAVTTWLACRMLGGIRNAPTFIGLLLASSAAVAFKATALPLVPFVVVVVIVATPGWRRWLWGAVALVTPIVLTFWWWGRNILVFHTLQPAGLPQAIMRQDWPAGSGPSLGGFLDTEWNRVTNSFWGQYGLLQYPSSPMIIDILSVTALGVLIVCGFRRGPLRRYAWCLAVLPLVSLATGLQNNWSSYLHTTQMGGIQGRYYFVTVAALAVMSAIAWRRAVQDSATRAQVGTVVVLCGVAMSVYGLSVAYRGYYEAGQFRVSLGGMVVLRRLVPVGPEIFLGVGVLTVLLLAAVCVVATRFVRAQPTPALATGADTTAETMILGEPTPRT